MSQESKETVNDEMKPEYDFSGGVRGKYYEAYTKSSYHPTSYPTDNPIHFHHLKGR